MKKIKTIIIAIIMILISETIFTIWDKYTIKEDFKKVKTDFEIVNKFLIDYYDKNCEDECYENKKMIFDVIENNNKTELLVNFEKNKFEITGEIKESINNIEKYYDSKVSGFSPDRISLISIDKETIKYFSEIHPPRVIYYRNVKPSKKEIHENKLENLSDNWYKTKYEHHL